MLYKVIPLILEVAFLTNSQVMLMPLEIPALGEPWNHRIWGLQGQVSGPDVPGQWPMSSIWCTQFF